MEYLRHKVVVSADCTNLLDKTYYDYSYIRQPGRWGKLGFMYRF